LGDTLCRPIYPIQYIHIAESFLAKNFGDIGTFGDMGKKVTFFVQKMKNA
jgi:hypothetical protein